MGARFVFTEEAERQLLEIVDYLANESASTAVRLRDAIYEAAGLLAERPGIGHTREDLTDRPVKFWSVFSYLIVYDPASRPLTIVAILHGARDVELLLKRKCRRRECNSFTGPLIDFDTSVNRTRCRCGSAYRKESVGRQWLKQGSSGMGDVLDIKCVGFVGCGC